MPRLPRIHVEGSIYYVTSKCIEGQVIFKDKADHKMFMDLLAKYKKQYQFRLYAFSLLPQRITLLLEPRPGSTISEIMHGLNSLYTKYFNGRYDRRGHLFESRFKSTFVEKSQQLAELTRHVHRQGLSSGETCTSLGSYAGTPVVGAPDMSEEAKEVLANLGIDPASYMRYVEAMSADETALLEKRLGRGGVVGSETFTERVKQGMIEAVETRAEAARPQNTLFRRLLAAALGALVVATVFSVYFYVSRERLKAHYENVVSQMQESLVTGSPLSQTPSNGEGPR